MAKCCSICNEKVGLLKRYNFQDGYCCEACRNRFWEAGVHLIDMDNVADFTVREAGFFLDEPEKWNEIAKERREKRKITSANCLICGKKCSVISGKYMTSDGYALCFKCAEAAITISPQQFLKEKDEKFIIGHNSQFFKDNMGVLERPHRELAVNFTKQRFYYAGALFTTEATVFSFDSVIKFESGNTTYEVTVGKKGHPIARAAVGGVMFGGAGAVVGAMTSKDTRHKETRNGKRCVTIYHRESTNPENICKRTIYCDTSEEFVKLEDCLKRAFEYRDAEQEQVSGNSVTTGTTSNNYSDLIELKKLLDMGVITQEEFDAKKKQTLGL